MLYGLEELLVKDDAVKGIELARRFIEEVKKEVNSGLYDPDQK